MRNLMLIAEKKAHLNFYHDSNVQFYFVQELYDKKKTLYVLEQLHAAYSYPCGHFPKKIYLNPVLLTDGKRLK